MTVFIHIIVCLASLNLGLSVRPLLCHKTIMHSITGKKAVDFQIFGQGLISVELVFLMSSIGLLKSYEEYEEFLRGRICKISFFIIYLPTSQLIN